jgi:phage baseplate assembly protein gpV
VNNKITTHIDPFGLWYISITINISLTFVGGPQLSGGLGIDTTTGNVNFTGTATGSVGICRNRC